MSLTFSMSTTYPLLLKASFKLNTNKLGTPSSSNCTVKCKLRLKCVESIILTIPLYDSFNNEYVTIPSSSLAGETLYVPGKSTKLAPS